MGKRVRRCGSWQWQMSQEVYNGEPERRQTFACRVLLYNEFLLLLTRGQSKTTSIQYELQTPVPKASTRQYHDLAPPPAQFNT